MERYESLGVVGEGSYGVVLKCRHRETGQIVAVKKFLESDEDQNVKKIALREVRMLKKLRHENLINLIEFFRRKRRLYLVFEYVDHTVLDELEARESGLEPHIARSHIFQVIRGVAFCHQNQIIHRDVKPENVLVSRLGVVKLCDFGFARILGPNETCTDYVATRWYRAPELLVGDTKYGREVDIWAIGCLLTEILSGEPLFPGESDIDQLFHIIQTCGELSPAHKQLVEKNPMLSGLRLPSAPSTPLNVTFPKWPTRTLNFISECLYLTPSKRPTAEGLLNHDYFTHDSFPDTFLPELQKKVQEEFNSNILLQSSVGRKSSGQNEKKTQKQKNGSPQTQSYRYMSKIQAAVRSPKKINPSPLNFSSSLIQQELSLANNSMLPQTTNFSYQNQHSPTSQSHSSFLVSHLGHPLHSHNQQSLSHLTHQTFSQQNMNSSRQFMNYSSSSNNRTNSYSFDDGPVSLPFTQIPPIKETQAINNDTLNNFPLFNTEGSASSAFHKNGPNINNMLNLQLMTSPSRSFRKEEKNKKSSQILWTSGSKGQALSVQGQSHYSQFPSNVDSPSQKDNKNLYDPTNSLSLLVPISPFSRHQFESTRHPYAISLDRTKESSAQEANRDPLREIRDNSKEGRKDLLLTNNSKDSYRKNRKETFGWAKPKLLNDDLYLPNVPGISGKNMIYSPNKTSRSELVDGGQKPSGSFKEKKLSGGLIPFLGGQDRGSASSSDSFETLRPGSNLPYV